VVEGRCGVQLDEPRAGLFNDMHRYLGSKRYRDKLSSEETGLSWVCYFGF
jgi:hypothetical protein